MIFYAKPDQTYEKHLDAVYTAWKETISAKYPLIERVAKRYNFSVKRFLKGSLLTIAFHDIGKMIEPFQEMMTDNYFDKRKNYRHELVSFVYTAKYWQLINKEEYLSAIPLEAIAVVGHHKSLDSDLTSFNRESVQLAPAIIPDGINNAIEIAKDLFEKELYVLPSIEQINKCEDPFKSLSNLIASGILSKGIEKDGDKKCRVIYFLLKGILHYADWYGSGKKRVIYNVNKDIPSVINGLRERCNKKGITFTGLRPFQQICSQKAGHLVAVAPTGSGKTEASILWALKNIQEMKSAKILYFLPTMVTANSTYKRLSDFFGKENVGLTHSTANLFLQIDSSLEAEEDKWENRSDVLFNQSFMKPVTVGTIDQLLTSGFNAGKWTLKELNASNAVIIIDEIHAYDGWTMGLIISAIRHFSSLGARFMLMSATMSKQLQQLLYIELKKATIVKEDTLLNAKRSKYFVVDDYIDSAIKDIEKALLDGKRVLVVVNTVGLCQKLADKLSSFNPVCYHSQFILKDRKAIEKKINNANLVVATQVVEVSLDIDCDWLFTECAPPDAIVQRAGRVNRYRDTQRDSRVYIFKASEKAEKIYNQINLPNFLERSFKEFFKKVTCKEELSENDLINIVETVYKDYRIKSSEAFKEAIQQYKLSQSNRNMIFDSRIGEDKQEVTRQSKYETVSVMPKCFKDKVLSLKPSKRQWFEVKIPAWYAIRHKEEIKGITFCDMDYDPNIGVIFTKDRDIASMII